VLRYEVTSWPASPPERTSIAGWSGPDEHFYGFGEKFDRLDQARLVVRTLAVDASGAKGDRSYAVAPWFMSTRGYGFTSTPRPRAASICAPARVTAT
jgi:hypothetical protein